MVLVLASNRPWKTHPNLIISQVYSKNKKLSVFIFCKSSFKEKNKQTNKQGFKGLGSLYQLLMILNRPFLKYIDFPAHSIVSRSFWDNSRLQLFIFALEHCQQHEQQYRKGTDNAKTNLTIEMLFYYLIVDISLRLMTSILKGVLAAKSHQLK